MGTETIPATGICSPVYMLKMAVVFFSGHSFPRNSEYVSVGLYNVPWCDKYYSMTAYYAD